MIDLILLSICFFGSILASYYDLKTTEVPDEILYGMSFLSLPFLFYRIFFLHEYHFLLYGTLFSLMAFLLYKLGQWGGADATLLSIFGFLFPENHFTSKIFPFHFIFLINLFSVGAIYSILYSILIIFKRKEKIGIKIKIPFIESILLFFFLFSFIYLSTKNFYSTIFLSLPLTLLFLFLFTLYRLLKLVERKIFIKRIPISELKVGDMLLHKRELKGVSKKEIEKIKKSGRKYVWIKEGVRFIPVFPISLFLTTFSFSFLDVIFNFLFYFR